VHWRKEERQGADLCMNFQETKDWKGRKANRGWVIIHCLKKGR
jgi:hypothetical protein